MCRKCTETLGYKVSQITCDMEREKLSNGKSIMGAGRLTDKAISTFQDY